MFLFQEHQRLTDQNVFHMSIFTVKRILKKFSSFRSWTRCQLVPQRNKTGRVAFSWPQGCFIRDQFHVPGPFLARDYKVLGPNCPQLKKSADSLEPLKPSSISYNLSHTVLTSVCVGVRIVKGLISTVRFQSQWRIFYQSHVLFYKQVLVLSSVGLGLFIVFSSGCGWNILDGHFLK
jgi:hypothetical protein